MVSVVQKRSISLFTSFGTGGGGESVLLYAHSSIMSNFSHRYVDEQASYVGGFYGKFVRCVLL